VLLESFLDARGLHYIDASPNNHDQEAGGRAGLSALS
jgi:hypothetical protein